MRELLSGEAQTKKICVSKRPPGYVRKLVFKQERERERAGVKKSGVDRPFLWLVGKLNKQQLLTPAFTLACATQLSLSETA